MENGTKRERELRVFRGAALYSAVNMLVRLDLLLEKGAIEDADKHKRYVDDTELLASVMKRALALPEKELRECFPSESPLIYPTLPLLEIGVLVKFDAVEKHLGVTASSLINISGGLSWPLLLHSRKVFEERLSFTAVTEGFNAPPLLVLLNPTSPMYPDGSLAQGDKGASIFVPSADIKDVTKKMRASRLSTTAFAAPLEEGTTVEEAFSKPDAKDIVVGTLFENRVNTLLVELEAMTRDIIHCTDKDVMLQHSGEVFEAVLLDALPYPIGEVGLGLTRSAPCALDMLGGGTIGDMSEMLTVKGGKKAVYESYKEWQDYTVNRYLKRFADLLGTGDEVELILASGTASLIESSRDLWEKLGLDICTLELDTEVLSTSIESTSQMQFEDPDTILRNIVKATDSMSVSVKKK